MSINPDYDGSQKKLFLDLVTQRIKYLEEMNVRLPKEIEEKKMEHKAVGEELMKLYNIIPPAPQLVDSPSFETFKKATRPYNYGGPRNG